MRAALAFALIVALAPRLAAASPAPVPIDDTRRDRVEMTGGLLHPFDDQWLYVATAEASADFRLSEHLSAVGILPLAMVDGGGETAFGWGNAGGALRYRAVSATTAGTWTGTLTWQVSLPTAEDHGTAGFAARSAADVHEAVDLGDFTPGTISSRVTAGVRWQGRRWWFAAALADRIHVFTFDRGPVELWQPLIGSVGAGARIARRWTIGVAVDTSSDVFEARWGHSDHFRHLVRAGGARSFATWTLEAGLMLPVDTPGQTPMLDVSVSRPLG